MSAIADWLVENRDGIEKAMEVIGDATRVLASTIGQFHPILEAVLNGASELLENPESKEARYLTEKFQGVNEKIEKIKDETDEISTAIKRGQLNQMNFNYEVQIISQYDRFMEFVNAKPKFKETKKEKFVDHYENTDRDMNMDALYSHIIGEGLKKPLLDDILEIEKLDRKVVENVCAKLKKLFALGLIAIAGYTALTEGAVKGKLMTKWEGRMEDVEKRMKAAVDYCIENFAKQAKEEMDKQLKESTWPYSPEFTKSILEPLEKKYDWVCWSVRAFKEKERFFFYNWFAGSKYEGKEGDNSFDILTNTKTKVVVSYCVNPKTIDKNQLQEKIEQQPGSKDMRALAQSVQKTSSCLVHALSDYKVVVEANNFPEDCYYFGRHRKLRAYVCVHSA